MAAEADSVDNLFGGMNVTAATLKDEAAYIDFGKKVGEVLYEGEAPYRIPAFFKELVRDLSK